MNPFSNRGVVMVAWLVLACTGRDDATAQRSATGSRSAQSICLAADEVTRTVGFPVKVLPQGTRSYGATEICAYQAVDNQGVLVSLTVQPEGGETDPMAGVRSGAKAFLGAQAEAEPVAIGDGGYAYGSGSKSEAAVKKGNRIYHADITASAGSTGDKKAAVIELLRQIVR
jgi:hypothetical protein